jgi:hypothetical protein
MADITWSDVEDHAAELSSVSAGAQTNILAFVNATLDVTCVGGDAGEDSPRVKLARVYLAAHLGTLALPGGAGGAGGPLTAESLGDEARSYGSFDMDPAYLAMTGYGALYLSMIRTSAARSPIVLGGY